MSAMSLPSRDSSLISPILSVQPFYPVSHLSLHEKAAEASAVGPAADGNNVAPYSHAQLKVRADCRTIHGGLFGSANFADPLSSHRGDLHRSSSDQQTVVDATTTGPAKADDPASVLAAVNSDPRERPFPLLSPFKYQPRTRECQSNIGYHPKRRSWLPNLMQSFRHQGAQSDLGRDVLLPRRRLTYTIPTHELIDVVDIAASGAEDEEDLQWPVTHITCKKWAEGVARAATRSWHSEPTRQKSRLWLDLTDTSEDSSIEEACVVKISTSPEKPRVTSITRSRTSTASTALTSFLNDYSSDEEDHAASALQESISSPSTFNASASQPDILKDAIEQSAPAPTVPCSKPAQTKLEAINEILGRVRNASVKISTPPPTATSQQLESINQERESTPPVVATDHPPPDPGQAAYLVQAPADIETEPSPVANNLSETELILNELSNLLTAAQPSPFLHTEHPVIHRIQRLSTTSNLSQPSVNPPALQSLNRIFPHASATLLSSLYSTLLALKFIESLVSHPEPSHTPLANPQPTPAPNAIPTKALLMLGLDRRPSTSTAHPAKPPSVEDRGTAERNARRRAMKAQGETVRTGLEKELEKSWGQVMDCVYETSPPAPPTEEYTPTPPRYQETFVPSDPSPNPYRMSKISERTNEDHQPNPGARNHHDRRFSSTSSRYTSLSSYSGLTETVTETDESEWLYGEVCFQNAGTGETLSLYDEGTMNRGSKRATLRSGSASTQTRGSGRMSGWWGMQQRDVELAGALEAAVTEVVRLGEMWVAEAEGEVVGDASA